jgi:hypothetical protein
MGYLLKIKELYENCRAEASAGTGFIVPDRAAASDAFRLLDLSNYRP